MADKIINHAANEDIAKRAAEIASACITEARNQRGDLEKQWREARQLWGGVSISDIFPADEIKHVAEPYNRTETVVPRIYTGVFGVGSWFSVSAKRPEFVKQEDALKDVITWQLSMDDYRFYSDQEDGIRNMAVDGTVVFKDDWHTKKMRVAERQVRERRPKTESGQVIGVFPEHGKLEMEDQTLAYPRARPLKLDDVFLDRYCNNLHDCRYIADRFTLTVEELEKRGVKAEGDEAAEYYAPNIENVKKGSQKHDDRKDQDKQNPLDTVVVYELWTTMEIGQQVKYVGIVIGQGLAYNQVLVVKENTFPGGLPPYQVGRYIKRPGEMYGMGAIIPIREASRELDEWRTMTMRGLELSISPPFIASDRAELESEQLLLFPGRVLSSPGGKEGLQPITIPVNQLSAQSMENTIRMDIAQTSRAPDTWGGGGGASRETAFEVGQRLQEAGLSLGGIIGRYRREVVKPILRNFLALNHMHLKEEVRLRKLGVKAFMGRKAFRAVDPKDIQAQFDFEILDTAEIAMLGNAAREWVNFSRALPPPLLNQMRWDRVGKDMLKSMGKEDPEQYMIMQPDEDDLIAAPEEHDLINQGHEPPVLAQHNHAVHVSQHQMFKITPVYEAWSPQKQAMLEKQIRNHYRFISRLVEKNLQAAQQVALGGPAPESPGRPTQGAAGPRGRVNMPRQETNTTQLQREAAHSQGQ